MLAAAVSKKVGRSFAHSRLARLTPEVVDWEIFGELNSYLAWRPLAESGGGAHQSRPTKTTVKIIQDGSIRFTQYRPRRQCAYREHSAAPDLDKRAGRGDEIE